MAKKWDNTIIPGRSTFPHKILINILIPHTMFLFLDQVYTLHARKDLIMMIYL